jgi:hypothetical protein
LCFVGGTLVPSGLTIVYERATESQGNEKNEWETNKGPEVVHLLQVTKNSPRLRFQNNGQSLATNRVKPERFSSLKEQFRLPDNNPSYYNPIFLKNRVFRL